MPVLKFNFNKEIQNAYKKNMARIPNYWIALKEWTELHKALHSPLWKFLDVVFISNYTREMTLDQALRLYAKSKKVKN